MRTLNADREVSRRAVQPAGAARFLGIDIGAETIKVVEVVSEDGGLRWTRRHLVEHNKEPGRALAPILEGWNWNTLAGAAVTGRFSREVNLPGMPVAKTQAVGCRFLAGDGPATVVSIGSHGFSVLELRAGGAEVYRGNSRCSQGTGNFLRQLVERFGLSVEQASEMSAGVENPAALSGRCPVILKTDMTHLANKGEDRARILAGLFDAVCDNVLTLIKPGVTPSRVILIGGVSRSPRVQRVFQRALAQQGMTLDSLPDDSGLFLEALGCALLAAARPSSLPPLDQLWHSGEKLKSERLPALSESLSLVTRMATVPPVSLNGMPHGVVLGFDIGSTGSKAVALELETGAVLWQGYRQTAGVPVVAAQALLRQFMESPAGKCRILCMGVTGSGREIVGSLMTTCYGGDGIYVLNEIAAHAEGALHFEPKVDTIFEIGGQDAKYIRLDGGRIVDCAMNEACSAGTGSFIEEQGRRFAGVRDVVHLSEMALAAGHGISLGQHCSVFMAEVVEEAVGAGEDQNAIIAGLYDAIIQNYLHRVKGSRSVGQVIFCQGMPFSSDALAAAVARQTGSRVVIPPSPGTVGALGIALLSRREVAWQGRSPLDPARFLGAVIERKETIVCKSTVGCNGAGNRCKIDCIHTVLGEQRQRFLWGGACSLYDKGTRKKKLPPKSPDPFRDREDWVRQVIHGRPPRGNRPRVAMTDQFTLNSLFPFFAAFVYELGLDLEIVTGGDHADLKRGIRDANVPFCAPMQLYHGLAARMLETDAEFVFLPMLREVPRVSDEPHAVTCPVVQASADMLRVSLPAGRGRRIVSPVINIGGGRLDSEDFLTSCRQVAADFGVTDGDWSRAFHSARAVQLATDARCEEIGRRALEFCAEHGIPPVIVLGRTYSIYNTVLNSNVPSILREQGAMGIPVDCFPVDAGVPRFPAVYWGYSQRIMRAAHQIRRTPEMYSVYCSNYSCGPDSFTLHFFAYMMEGRPFAVIETDGHSGDAGTKTRVEAFLHCVEQDRKRNLRERAPGSLPAVPVFEALPGLSLGEIRDQSLRLLIPSMGIGSEVIAACLRGMGLHAEALPQPDSRSVRVGRRYTSGKECLPACVTLGSLLQRLAREKDSSERFAFLMPRTNGPCRLGVYNLLHQIVLERLGWKDRVGIFSPPDSDYFAGTDPGFPCLAFAGIAGAELLQQALHDVRPVELKPGQAQAIYDRYMTELLALVTERARGRLSVSVAVWEVVGKGLFGVRALLRRAAEEFAAARGPGDCPTVLLVGEVYVRCDPFSNDFVAAKLEARGVRVRLTPFGEWLDYVRHLNDRKGRPGGIRGFVESKLQTSTQRTLHQTMAGPLGWGGPVFVEETIAAARPYLRDALEGEAVLTIGAAVLEWRHGHIDGVLSVGPLECMPNKVAEAQLAGAAEKEGVLSLTLSLNGDPLEGDQLDNFVFEVKAHFQKRTGHSSALPVPSATRHAEIAAGG